MSTDRIDLLGAYLKMLEDKEVLPNGDGAYRFMMLRQTIKDEIMEAEKKRDYARTRRAIGSMDFYDGALWGLKFALDRIEEVMPND